MSATTVGLLRRVLCGVLWVGWIGELSASQSLPMWQGLDSSDRRYESNVRCEFVPLITANGGQEILYPLIFSDGSLSAPASSFTGFATVRESLEQNCQVCMGELQNAKSILWNSGKKYFQDRCYLKECVTESGRKIAVDRRIFSESVNSNSKQSYYCQLKSSQTHTGVKQASGEVSFYNLYSRPNDDRFQNKTTGSGSGEPYEVAVVHCGLKAVPQKFGGSNLYFTWKAEITTGRHVESGLYFDIEETKNSIGPTGKPRPLQLGYPVAVDAKSTLTKKKGSVMYAEVPLGSIEGSGKFSGALHIKLRERATEGSSQPGISQLVGAGVPGKAGVFQTLAWDIVTEQGLVSEARVHCERFSEPQLKLVDSNYQRIDRRNSVHRHYLVSEPAANCAEEQVGDGNISTAFTRTTVLEKKVGEMILSSGCLDCHDSGNKELFRFCDDGSSIQPSADASTIFSLVGTVRTNPGSLKYPAGMIQALKVLSAEDQRQGDLIKKWREANP